jgi:hypothetical protein
MTYVNVSPNLRDMFQSLSDRINKLELAPNGPQDTADYASSQATEAQTAAYVAGVQAVQASAQATIASTQATYAVQTANGKNTVSYGTASPSTTPTPTNGDLYFQFNGSNQVIAQYTWNGSSWVSNPITSTVIASINAGSIVSGTITGIEYNNGSGTFSVSTTGTLQATNAYITGSVKATAGYFGSSSNGWIIDSTGLTGSGTGYIRTASSGNYVVMSGNSNALGFYVASNAQGWITPLAANGVIMHYGSSANGGGTSYPSVAVSSVGASLYGASGVGIGVTSSQTSINGTAEVTGAMILDSVPAVGSPTSANYNTLIISKTSSGATLGRVYGYNNLSSEIYKENITNFANKDYLGIVNQMRPVTFNYKADQVIDPDSVIMGMIAEDLNAIPGAQDLVEYDKGLPSAIKYDKIPLFLIKAIQTISNRLDKLEGK